MSWTTGFILAAIGGLIAYCVGHIGMRCDRCDSNFTWTKTIDSDEFDEEGERKILKMTRHCFRCWYKMVWWPK